MNVSAIRVNETVGMIGEESGLEGAVESRRNEFRAGRRCAREALRIIESCDVAILRDESGLPLWPEGILGSISHSRGICGAVVGKISCYQCLGFDLERVDRLSEAASLRVIHPCEVSFVKGDQRLSSLLFSAKEAFFKAQYPRWREPMNFHDIGFEVDEGSGLLQVAEIRENLPDGLKVAALAMRLCFVFRGNYVATVCSV